VAEDRPQHVEALERAVTACRQDLVDYQTGLLDEQQLRRALYRDGLILGNEEAWLLDVADGSWRRYDGISTEAVTVQPDDGRSPARTFDAATLRRWQRGLRGLQAANRMTGMVGGG